MQTPPFADRKTQYGRLLDQKASAAVAMVRFARIRNASEDLLKALEEAEQALKTISQKAGRDELMDTMPDVRAYASSRAEVAAAAIAIAKAKGGSHAG